MWVQSLGQEDPLEKEMVTHSSILAWKIPWTEEPVGLQSTELHGVVCDLVTKQQQVYYYKLPSTYSNSEPIGSPLVWLSLLMLPWQWNITVCAIQVIESWLREVLKSERPFSYQP